MTQNYSEIKSKPQKRRPISLRNIILNQVINISTGIYIKIRHLAENTFARLKHFRGIATRYDKLKQNYENSVALACTLSGYYYEMATDPNQNSANY